MKRVLNNNQPDSEPKRQKNNTSDSEDVTEATIEQRLMQAAAQGDLELLNSLMGHAAIKDNPTIKIEALCVASANGHTIIVEKLIQLGADVNKVDVHGWSPLDAAARNGHTQIVEKLLQSGADVNQIDVHGWSPLHRAARNGHTQIVEKLIEFGADVQKSIGILPTPLILSVKYGHSATAKSLIGANAPLTPQIHQYARQGNNQEIIRFLQDAQLFKDKLSFAIEKYKDLLPLKEQGSLTEYGLNNAKECLFKKMYTRHDALLDCIKKDRGNVLIDKLAQRLFKTRDFPFSSCMFDSIILSHQTDFVAGCALASMKSEKVDAEMPFSVAKKIMSYVPGYESWSDSQAESCSHNHKLFESGFKLERNRKEKLKSLLNQKMFSN